MEKIIRLLKILVESVDNTCEACSVWTALEHSRGVWTSQALTRSDLKVMG